METFSALLALCVGNSPVSGEFPAQRPVTRSFDAFFDLRLIKRLSKNTREAADLRRYRAHYGVIVMYWVRHTHSNSANMLFNPHHSAKTMLFPELYNVLYSNQNFFSVLLSFL